MDAPGPWLSLTLALVLLLAVRPARGQHPAYGASVRVGPFPQDIAHLYTVADGLAAEPVLNVELAQNVPTVRTVGGWARLDGARWVGCAPPAGAGAAARPAVAPPKGIDEPVVASCEGEGGVRWAATARAVYRVEAGRAEQIGTMGATPGLPGARLRCLAADRAGALWAGTDGGAAVYQGGAWQAIDGRAGLPVLDVRAIALGDDGAAWFGTPHGAARLLRGRWRYYAGRRWLPDDRVNAIAVAPGGDAWIGTDGGVARIEFRAMRFAEKAAHYEAITAARHNRRGYVTDCHLRRPGDLSSYVHHASDNDGLWTALYVMVESFRYAVTRDPQARALAGKSMDALLDLVEVTGIPGFMARAVKRSDEEVVGYSPDEPNWQHISPRDPDLYWKGDTSSDEVDGHFLAWYVYHTLVADAAEKRRIEAACRAVANHIIDHGFNLVGPSGKPTTWGVWAPEKLNDDPEWTGEHGLNALEILSHLRVAYHLCGDARFRDAYDALVRDHHYAINTVDQKVLPPRGSNNHSDDELAWCAYYPLLSLEKDPALRRLYLESLARTQRILEPEGSPFYNFLHGAFAGFPCGAEAGVEWLRNAPWDLVDWTMTNSHRADVEVDARPDRFGRPQSTRVLPNSERAVTRWNANPYALDAGSGGRSEMDGAFWLLPYWLGRYHGIIEEAAAGAGESSQAPLTRSSAGGR